MVISSSLKTRSINITFVEHLVFFWGWTKDKSLLCITLTPKDDNNGRRTWAIREGLQQNISRSVAPYFFKNWFVPKKLQRFSNLFPAACHLCWPGSWKSRPKGQRTVTSLRHGDVRSSLCVLFLFRDVAKSCKKGWWKSHFGDETKVCSESLAIFASVGRCGPFSPGANGVTWLFLFS